jgi:uncharacterized protein YgiM (DUF1202 family)
MTRLIIILVLASLACGMQAVPTVTPVTINTDVPYLHIAETVPTATNNAPRYYVTAPLNVRAEANADSQKLGHLKVGTEVTVLVTNLISGGGCKDGGWLAITAPEAGYICSLYLEER